MAVDWIIVRLDRKTRALLEVVRQGMRFAAEQGNLALDMDSQGRVSLDQVVRELAYGCLKHRKRSRDAKCRSAARRRAARIESNARQADDRRRGPGLGGNDGGEFEAETEAGEDAQAETAPSGGSSSPARGEGEAQLGSE